MSSGVSVTFLPAGVSTSVPTGSTVLDTAVAAGQYLSAPCGGRGRCGRCAVRIVEGALSPPDKHEAAVLTKLKHDSGTVRLACHARIVSPVVLRPLVPPSGSLMLSSGHLFPLQEASSVTESVRVAVDLGTTTVAVRVLQGASDSVLAEGRATNRQSAWGADILTRITRALSGDAAALSAAAVDSVNDALTAALGPIGISEPRIVAIAVAANPAMASLLMGLDVRELATHPFISALHHANEVELARTFLAEKAMLVPSVASFVGGDLIAGLIGVGLDGGADGVLYIDAGTNAEVALVLPDRLLVSSAPAGPAFEAGGIACGGAAGYGGVTRFEFIDGEASLAVDSGPPTHLTGSGLISAVAALRSSGYLSPDGLLLDDSEGSGRMFEMDGIRAVSLGLDPSDRSLFITQLDIRAFQVAKAAVATAVKALIVATDHHEPVKQVIISGAFGGALSEADLVALGLVPENLANHVGVVADAVLTGTAEMIVDAKVFESAQELAERAEHVDLTATEGFSAAFVESLDLAPYCI